MTRTTGDRWYYHPSRKIYARPEDYGLDHVSVSFESEGHRLHGWFLPAQGESLAGQRDSKGTVVHCHGNGGNLSGHLGFVAWMPSFGWNVFVFDYQGFGESQGVPTRHGTIADTHAAIDHVVSRDDVDASRVVVFGQSLGGSVAIVVAAERSDLRGLAVEGAFSDYQREARFISKKLWWLWGIHPFSNLLVSRGHDPIDHVGRVSPTPLFFITGTADEICDYRQTIDLHAAAREPKSLWVVEGGRHMGALVETDGRSSPADGQSHFATAASLSEGESRRATARQLGGEGPRRLDAFFTSCVEPVTAGGESA